jgi:hypothetical protein
LARLEWSILLKSVRLPLHPGCDEVGGIIECWDIDERHQLSQGGQSGMDVVRYVQRPWGILVRNRGSKGMDGCPLTGTITRYHG